MLVSHCSQKHRFPAELPLSHCRRCQVREAAGEYYNRALPSAEKTQVTDNSLLAQVEIANRKRKVLEVELDDLETVRVQLSKL